MFKYELHLHTKACSACGISTIGEMIEATKKHGYQGIAVTNHFYNGGTRIDQSLPWEEFVGAYEADWLEGKALGDKLDIDVIFAVEHVYTPGKEVLIYGITPEEFKAETDFKRYSLEQISAFVRNHGGFLSHAHPFRVRPYIREPDAVPDPALLDGIEVYNGSGAENRNELAREFADKHGLKYTSGGDVHKATVPYFAKSGIAVEKRITDTKELASTLRSGDYHIIVDGEIQV